MSHADAVPAGRQKVRVTMRPGEEIEISAREARVLRRQGLLVDDTKAKAPAADGKPSDGPAATAGKQGDNKAGGPGKDGS